MIVIDPDFKAMIPPLARDELAQLEANLLADGCRDPLVVWPAAEHTVTRDGVTETFKYSDSVMNEDEFDPGTSWKSWESADGGASLFEEDWPMTLIDGHNRYQLCQKHNINFEVVTQEFPARDDAFLWIARNQLGRRNLTDLARIRLAERIRPIVEARARGRMVAGVKQDPPAKLPEGGCTGETRDTLAAAAGVSGRTYAKGVEVLAKGAPELVQAVESKAVSIHAAAAIASLPEPEQQVIVAKGEREILEAAKAIRQEKAKARKAENEALKAAAPVAIPSDRYSVIVIDPPWEMQKIERDERPQQVAFDYPTMTEPELAAFDVARMAHDDCHLFCWTTHKHLPMALRLLETWGFRYVLTMVWHKPGGFQPYGLPQYNCEFVLYARRGTPTFVDTKAFFCCFNAPRREHSRKPDDFYDIIRRVTDGPRIDVFSREPREGFDQFGNEPERFVA